MKRGASGEEGIASSEKQVVSGEERMASSEKQVASTRIAIFASGKGSNAQKIIDYFSAPSLPGESDFEKRKNASVALIVSNNPGAGVLNIAKKENIPFLVIERNKFYEDGYLSFLKESGIDIIVLAGFMWKVPPILIKAFPNRIINIHPALLPKYGGKNMYGDHVHAAVINAREKESGITIHYVDELYDHGKIIFQAKCTVDNNETLESLANKIHTLEHEHYPKVIAGMLI